MKPCPKHGDVGRYLSGGCKGCRNEAYRKYAQKPKPAKVCPIHRLSERTANGKCKFCHRAYNREYARAQAKEVKKNSRPLSKFGISFQEYLDMFQRQSGLCPVGNHPMMLSTDLPTKSIRPEVACVDHEHVPGFEKMSAKEKKKFVRGLLCHRHNAGLGHFGDNPVILDAGAAYLRAWLSR